jgi:hypothetical protein
LTFEYNTKSFTTLIFQNDSNTSSGMAISQSRGPVPTVTGFFREYTSFGRWPSRIMCWTYVGITFDPLDFRHRAFEFEFVLIKSDAWLYFRRRTQRSSVNSNFPISNWWFAGASRRQIFLRTFMFVILVRCLISIVFVLVWNELFDCLVVAWIENILCSWRAYIEWSNVVRCI